MSKIVCKSNTSNFNYFRLIIWSLFQLVGFSCFGQAPVISYQTPQTYNAGTAITPLVPTNTGGAVPTDGAGILTTVASGFNTPTSVAVDLANNVLYVADWNSNQIKKVDLTTKAVTVFAGSGAPGPINGTGTAATFDNPDAIIRDNTGNLYVSDMDNNMIRKITPAGVVTTLAGNGTAGSADGTGTAATFYTPRGLGMDAAGNLYVADQANNKIRKITPAGVVTTVASGFSSPTGVDVDAAGNLFVSDLISGSIKKVTPDGTITTVVSGVGQPREIRVDGAGNLYVSDQNGSVKKISPSGTITVLATGIGGPIGLALDGMGSMYIAASSANTIVKITVGGYSIDKPLPTGLVFDPTTGIISGTPTAGFPLTVYTITARNAAGSSSTTLSITVNGPKLPSLITFPGFESRDISGNIVDPGAYSTNTQTPIIYTSDNPAVATVTADGKLQIHAPGTATITANQAGNVTYSPALPVTSKLTVVFGQELIFPAIAVKTPCSTDFALNVADKDPDFDFPVSGLPITYTSSNPSVATVSASGMVHILTAGITRITAYQKGDNLYYADATPVGQVLTVTADVAPVLNILIPPMGVCAGLSVNFKANVTNLADLTNPTYQWQLNGNNVGSNQNSFATVVNDNDVIKCIVTNNTACPTPGSAQVGPMGVSPNKDLKAQIIAIPAGAVCPGTSVKFVASSTNVIGKADYQWQINGTNVGTNDSVYVSNSLNSGDNITCTVNNGLSRYCGTPSTSTPITMSILPQTNINASVSVQASGNNVYAGTPVTFTAVAANATGTLTYQWQVNGKNAGSNTVNFTTSALSNGDIITCIINSSALCSVPFVSPAITETVLPPVKIIAPNTFTPNGDGINDTWQIAGLNTYPNSTVAVYNRYGLQVYYSKGYTKPWDGTDNGKALPVGTYYYVITTDQNKPKVSGYVAVIR